MGHNRSWAAFRLRTRSRRRRTSTPQTTVEVRRCRRESALPRADRHLSRWVLGHRLRDTEAGFKFFDREAILPILDRVQDTGWFWDTEIMIEAHRAGLRIAEIPCVFRHRRDSASTVRLTRDVWNYLVQIYRYRRRRRVDRTEPWEETVSPRGLERPLRQRLPHGLELLRGLRHHRPRLSGRVHRDNSSATLRI
jgi:hypothetical protein